MLFRFVFHFIFKQAPAAVLCGLVSMAALAYYPPDLWNAGRVVYTKRNYYGISKVVDSDGIRILYHGDTLHGAQYLAQDKRGELLAYYSPQLPGGRSSPRTFFLSGVSALLDWGQGPCRGMRRRARR